MVFLVGHSSLKSVARSETRSQINSVELEAALPEPRAYIPDSQHLDFVFHNHEELTKFLRFCLIIYSRKCVFYVLL